ncbi:MAG TPA: CBS domain-containing protein [Pyrinomonadaceae bacterium]|jgi:CBS domain-containing protein
MSRYREDRDSRDYREGADSRDWGPEGRYDQQGGDYRRRNPDFGVDDPYATRARSLGERDFGREHSGRGRFGERAEYDSDEPSYRGQPSRNLDEREGNGRSLYEEGRDYLRRKFGEHRTASRSRVRCRDIMTRDVTVATRNSTLEDVARMMREEDAGVIPVAESNEAPQVSADAVDEARRVNTRIYGNGKLVGLITDRDIVVRAVAEGKDCHTTRAEEIMTTEVYTAKPNDRVIDAIRKMGDKQVRRIPVVGDNGNLRGIISMADVALETEEDRELAEALEEISSGSSFWNRMFG